MIPWPRGCADITTTDSSYWPHAESHVLLECEYLGPAVIYARFESRAVMRREVLAAPPGARIAAINRASDAQLRCDRAAERKALERYFDGVYG